MCGRDVRFPFESIARYVSEEIAGYAVSKTFRFAERNLLHFHIARRHAFITTPFHALLFQATKAARVRTVTLCFALTNVTFRMQTVWDV